MQLIKNIAQLKLRIIAIQILGCLVLLCSNAQAQLSWEWVYDITDNNNELPSGIVVDPSNGDNYTVGNFQGSLTTSYPTGVNNTPAMIASGVQG